MKMLTVFDPAMCCSTGVCGSDVDQVLVNFSADVQWLKGRGGVPFSILKYGDTVYNNKKQERA